MRSRSEEDYLKAIYTLSENSDNVSTNDLAGHLEMKASSITDMLKKLKDKGWVNYVKYKGVTLSPSGLQIALNIVRKHRLWETFLVNQLHFKWDEVHEIAEQLEHINSPELIKRLDNFLGFPKYDPHGDPIPDQNGEIRDTRQSCLLTDLRAHIPAKIIGVNDTSSALLQYLEREGMVLGTPIIIKEIYDFDNSLKIDLNGRTLNISDRVAQNLLVQIKE